MARKLHFIELIAIISLLAAGGCASTGPSSGTNLAADRMGGLAGIGTESDAPSAGVVPNLRPIVDAGKLAAANTEAMSVKTAARAYLVDHISTSRVISDDLWPGYISAAPQARYYVNPVNSLIIRVDSISSGWTNMVFNLTQQKWVEGTPDNNHASDQDVP